jgi:hypothetical protein
MRLPDLDGVRLPPPSLSTGADRHAHHRLSRRAFMGSAAGLTATAVGASLLRPASGQAAPNPNASPKPTTNVFSLNGVDFHLTFFGAGMDPATITDFNGFVGVAAVQGHGTGTHPDDTTEQLVFDTDMRFMRGTYVGQDGAVHRGDFAFV